MPPLTQTLGPVLLPSSKTTYEGRLSDEMELLEALVTAIPRAHIFSMHCHHSLTNWLPFYWAGYQQTTRYTYIIPDLSDLNSVFAGFAHSKKGNIRKAEGLVTVHEDMAPKDFYENQKMTLRKQGKTISYSYDLFKRIHDAGCQMSGCKTFYALDKNDNVHAAIFIVFDSKSAYYLVSSIDPDYRSSGSATLLLREAIVYASKHTRAFDLEGSMIRGVENSFRKLGGIQTPYFRISKYAAFPPIGLCLDLAGGLRRLWPKGQRRLRGEPEDT
ncbi:MAG: GNAT family N-acetyltransferase [Dehalococcoidia bacterium]|nr:GNAT family N-acetyltransferase [Dehalococcoidia bacterium]